MVWGGGVGQGLEEGLRSPSRHRNYTHGVGEAGTRAPPGQHNDHISLLEEASGLSWRKRRELVNEKLSQEGIHLGECPTTEEGLTGLYFLTPQGGASLTAQTKGTREALVLFPHHSDGRGTFGHHSFSTQEGGGPSPRSQLAVSSHPMTSYFYIVTKAI